MTDSNVPPIPPASPGDQLVGRVILCVTLVTVLSLLLIGVAMVIGAEQPKVLETAVVASISSLGALLAGRTRG